MTLRVKIVLIVFITVIVAVLIGVGISLFTFYKKSKTPANVVVQTVNQAVEPADQDIVEKPDKTPPAPLAPQEISQEDKARGAINSIVPSFVETFGSYSNQSGFENMSNLLPYMTPSMKSWAQEQIDKALAKPIPEIYKGITTRTKNHTIEKFNLEEGVAEVMVETQRKELVGESTNFETMDKNILVRLKKHNGVWLVDGAFWQ